MDQLFVKSWFPELGLSLGITLGCLSGWNIDIAVRESLLLFPRKSCSLDDDFEGYAVVWSN